MHFSSTLIIMLLYAAIRVDAYSLSNSWATLKSWVWTENTVPEFG